MVFLSFLSISITPGDSLTFTSKPRTNLKFALDLSVLSMVSMSFMVLACVLAVIGRIVALRYKTAHILTPVLPIGTIIAFVFIIIYYVGVSMLNVGNSGNLV